MMNESIIHDVKMSYGRALADKNLMKRFYENFISSHPSVPLKFEGVDLARQQEILKMSLSMAIIFPQDNVVAKRSMGKLRESHGEGKMAIAPEFYGYWLDSLMDTIRVCDPEFTDELGSKWRTVLAFAIEHISCPKMRRT